jgi:hypothetical protein
MICSNPPALETSARLAVYEQNGGQQDHSQSI